MFEQVIGKKSQQLSAQQIAELAAAYPQTHIDIGTGDGLFAWRKARKQANCFVIGIDADRDSLAEGSARAIKKPARGGAANALFLCANVLELPTGLENSATSISINFPWGSLMYALAECDEQLLKTTVNLCKNHAEFEIYLNLQVFQDDGQRERMSLDEMTPTYVEQTMLPKFASVGLNVTSHSFDPPEKLKDVASTWAGKLLRRSGRDTLVLKGVISK